MDRCCTLLNPSQDKLKCLYQKLSLAQTAGHLVCPAPEHKCIMSISINLDTLEQSIKNLPKNFCFKVLVPDVDCDYEHVFEPEQEFLGSLSKVASAIMEQYDMSKDDTICMVVDIDKPSVVTPAYVNECCQRLDTTKLVIFTIGTAHPESLNDFKDTIILPYVDPNDILSILANTQRHILTGSLLGWWGAALSKSKLCIRPSPWRAGAPSQASDYHVPYKWPYTKYFDKIYYINLDRRTDRRDHMEKQLGMFGLAATRISAVDGKSLKWKPEYGVISNYWNIGAFAYCISYRAAIIDAIKLGLETILVMDDDAVLTEELFDVLAKAKKDLPSPSEPSEWHMLYLGANHGYPEPLSMPTEKERIGDHLYRLTGSMGSHAIILHKRSFSVILNFLSAPYAPLDMFFSMYQKFFPCYVTYPGLASQLPGHSDILDKDVNYTDDWNIDYIHHIKGRC